MTKKIRPDAIYLDLEKDEIKEMISNSKLENLTVRRNTCGARIEVELRMEYLLKSDGAYGPKGELKRFVKTVRKEAKQRGADSITFVVNGEIGDFAEGQEYTKDLVYEERLKKGEFDLKKRGDVVEERRTRE